MKQYSFPKEKRICGNNQFLSIIRNGKCLRNPKSGYGGMTIYFTPNECGFSRLGISIGKSYGNAVERNRMKRLIREVFRLNQNEIPSGYDYIVLTKKKMEQPSFERIQEDFLGIVLHKK